MTKHIKEPWKIGFCGEKAETFPIESDDGLVFITDAAPDDARRIVACVNACAGLSTAELETYKRVDWLSDGLAAMTYKQHRDELLAALECIAASFGQEYMRELAVKAIAKERP